MKSYFLNNHITVELQGKSRNIRCERVDESHTDWLRSFYSQENRKKYIYKKTFHSLFKKKVKINKTIDTYTSGNDFSKYEETLPYLYQSDNLPQSEFSWPLSMPETIVNNASSMLTGIEKHPIKWWTSKYKYQKLLPNFQTWLHIIVFKLSKSFSQFIYMYERIRVCDKSNLNYTVRIFYILWK